MTSFNSFSYDIQKRLPEWWKEDGLAHSVNEYTQRVIAEILENLLTKTMGVVQPLNVWKTIPEEYTWYHHYEELDDYLLYYNNDEEELMPKPVCRLYSGDQTIVMVPNTKRKCHAKIKMKLTGGSIDEDKQTVDELIFRNGSQQIILRDIPKVCNIEILTESNQIIIDDGRTDYYIEGEFNKLEPTIKYPDYKIPYIDEHGETRYEEIPLQYENKETKITIESTNDRVDFDLQVYLLKPTYTTEQNIKLTSVSAFPIEWVRLYGYFCHPFNNKEGYEFLWEKKYTEESRTVYDRITKQYDCERFFIQVKFYGIGVPLTKGFPQEIGTENPAYMINDNLDRWGKIYGLQRRFYKTSITEDEEPFTFPQYYPYPVEQDYWYEERMLNEYKFNEDAVNSWFIKDTDFNNVGVLECVYPFMNDIWVYTETIDPDETHVREFKDIKLCANGVKEIKDSYGKSWGDEDDVFKGESRVVLNPYNEETLKLNDYSYQTKKLKLSFCLNNIEPFIPKNIVVKGIELKFKCSETLESDSVKIRDDSYIILPFDSQTDKNLTPVLEKINIGSLDYWKRTKNYFTVGGKNELFGLDEITREQIFFDNNQKLEFEVGFINDSNFLEGRINLSDISLAFYYEIIPDDFDINVEFDKKQIVLDEEESRSVNMTINIKNNSKKEILGKNLLIVTSPELEIIGNDGANNYDFELDIDEEFSINTKIKTKEQITGLYDVLVICDDKVIENEIIIRRKSKYGV